jgi:Flp pilus assembly pilin Flp
MVRTTVWRRLVGNDAGQDLIEYGLLTTFVSLAALIVLGSLGTVLADLWTRIASELTARF